MGIIKKISVLITFGFFMLAPFSVEAIQLQTVGNPNTWSTVSFHFAGTDSEGLAGEFQLILGTGDDAFDTVGYCVELEEHIAIPEIYDFFELKPVAFRPNGLDAAWLMNEYAYGLGNEPADATVSAMDAKAALQLAIWDTIYGDRFTVLGATSDAIETLYTDYIGSLATAKENNGYDTAFAANFSIAHKDQVQDLMVYQPNGSGAVPEPGTIFLMGCGLISLGLIRKKSSV